MPAKSSVPDFKLPAQRIVESAGAEWVGPQETAKGTLCYFRDPATRTCLALYEGDVTVSAVKSRMKYARVMFGTKVRS